MEWGLTMSPYNSLTDSWRPISIPCIVIALLGIFGPGVASAQSTIARQDVWVPDSDIFGMAATEDTVFLGGRFSHMGPYSGGLSAFSPATGEHLQAFPQVNGIVEAIVEDGDGGWYIGGDFQGVGGAPHYNIARIQANGLPCPEFHCTVFGRLHAVHLDGDTLYIGGDRLFVNGEHREGVAAIDAHTGALLALSVAMNGSVYAIAATEDHLFVGGQIYSVNDIDIQGLAILDKETGALTNGGFGADGIVRVMAQDDTHLYVGGSFSTVAGQPRQNLALFDAIDGTLTEVLLDCNDTVQVIAFTNDYLFLGGRFSSINGAFATRAVALDRQTYALARRYPLYFGGVNGLAALGDTLYVGGIFNCIADINCTTGTRNIAAFDIASEAPREWAPNPSNAINALAVSDGIVLAGGNQVFLGGVERNRFAAIDMTTGQPREWTLSFDANVTNLAVYQDRLYVARRRSTTGPPAYRLEAYVIDQIGPPLWRVDIDFMPTGIAAEADRVFVSGDFDTIGNEPRHGIAALSTSDGTVLGWNAQLNGPVLDIELKDARLTIAGAFSTVQGVPAEGVAVLRALNGQHLSSGLSAGQPLGKVTFDSTTQTIFATPPFGAFQGVRAWRYDPSADIYSPLPNLASEHLAMELAANGENVFIETSEFSLVSGRSSLRSYSVLSNEKRPWDPKVRDTLREIRFNDTALLINGTFRGIGSLGPAFFAVFPDAPSTPNAVAIEALEPLAPNASSIAFGIRFDKPVVSFDRPQDIQVIHSGTGHDTITIDGAGAYYVARLDGLHGDGAIQLAVNTGWNVQDIEGVPLASSVVSEPVSIDRVEPVFSDLSFSQSIAKEGDLVFLGFEVSEDLAGPPVVHVNGAPAEPVDGLSPQFLKDAYHTAGKGMLQHFDYVYVVEVGSRSGTATISIVGIDEAGNVGALTQNHGLYLLGNASNLPLHAWALVLLALVLLWLAFRVRHYP